MNTSPFLQFAANLLAPAIIAVLIAWLHARRSRLDDAPDLADSRRVVMFYFTSAVLSVPISLFTRQFGGPAGAGPLFWVPLHLVFIAPLGAIVAELTYTGVRNRRRTALQRDERCLRCGYSLHRNTSGRCPECGERTGAGSSGGESRS